MPTDVEECNRLAHDQGASTDFVELPEDQDRAPHLFKNIAGGIRLTATSRRLRAAAIVSLGLASLYVGSISKLRTVEEVERFDVEANYSKLAVSELDRRTALPWEHKTFQPEHVAENMVYVDCDGKNAVGAPVPAIFAGLWWMDGNPAPETVASFGHATWMPGVEACKEAKMQTYSDEERNNGVLIDPFGDTVPCQGRMIVPFWEDRIWAMPDTHVGGTYEKVGTAGNSNMEFVCGGNDPNDLTICKVGASTGTEQREMLKRMFNDVKDVGAQAFNFLARFSMVKVNSDYWIRYSLDGVYPYHLKRITDCAGAKVEPHWSQFMSQGTAKPIFQKDIYGHGGDTRDHVAKVPELLFVRWNKAPPPVGSGFFCSRFTGGTCNLVGCSSWRNAKCVKKQVLGESSWACECGEGECEENGMCRPQCEDDTGGTCRIFGCDGSRHAQCDQGHCKCATNECAVDGVCIPECWRDTGGSCNMFGCAASRGATCERGKCMCKPGECPRDGACFPRAS